MENFIYKNKIGITSLFANIEKFSYKTHAHEEYALGVTLNGIQKYKLEGVPLKSYKNGVMLFNPEALHDGQAGDKNETLNYMMIYIKPELFLQAIGEKDIVKFPSSIVYNEKLKQDVLNLSSSILHEKDEALCNELLLNLADNFSPKYFVIDYKQENKLIKKAKEMIYYELDNVLDLEYISKELNMTKFEFIRIFKANTKITPYQFFLNCKLIHAKKYLEETKDIYATIVEYGFTDISHFNRHFKKMYGTTAYKYLLSLN
ncbi:AraC family transcriptional regulator [Halarcobacter ebronensis]|uniref:AraC family transcriptional regulator n=1 Tax=Halarcobacter ebronensis TaxID=1462615 RepID=A0A4Q0YFL8_9BACT|nr:AraC family transcriptional regulator [Halarcobacter ebronensis]RXJ69342.1 AraC family transcriptional regulator [Halarcobacter ebronensis]